MKLKKENYNWHKNKAEIINGIGRIYLTDKKKEVGVAIVDRDDLFRCIIQRKWRLTSTGNVTGFNGKDIKTLGSFIVRKVPSGMFVFHKDNNKLNFQKENLWVGSYNNQHSVG